jgi:hypothetical protein
MTSWVRGCVSAATVLAAAGLAGPVQAETRALLVGVTEYTSPGIPDLEGPTNDLVAMEQLLRAQGATDISVLRDGNATRTSIETAVHALGLRAKPGDWVVVYFSGHGAQAQAAQKGDEDDNLDEFLVLSGLDLEKPDPEQYITDNDFHAWFALYIPPQVDVLQMADACHSGTLNRSVDRRAWRFTPRLAAYRGDAPLQLTRPAPRFADLSIGRGPQAAAGEVTDLPNVVFIGAAQDDQLALEASLPTESSPSRGLLTYSFEQALTAKSADGAGLAADTDRDGTVSIGELGAYLDAQTRALTGSRQWSSTRFPAGRERAALFKASRPAATQATAAPAPPKPAVFAADRKAAALLAGQPGWTVAARATDADFVWDAPAGTVLRRSGDVVARRVTALPALRGVLEKWAVMEQLRPLLSTQTAKVVIGPKGEGARYDPGARVNVAVTTPSKPTAAAAPYVTVFNLAADGEVQTLYPVGAEDGDGRAPARGGAIDLLTTQVVEPYGADHVLAVITPQKPDGLRGLLRTLEGSRASAQVAAAVRSELAKGGAGAGVSVGELYTGPS